MPLPAIVPPLIAAGGAIAGAGVNAGMTGKMNRKSMRFSREMYDRQQADNLANWHLQNDYNSPAAQMKRFQEAGLNPHLIYGQGNSGPAGSVQTPDVQTPQFRTPEWGNSLSAGSMSFFNAIADLEIKQAQADNLRAQNNVIVQDAMLRAKQIEQVGASTNRSIFDLNFEKDLQSVSADARRESLRQLKTSTDLSLNRDAREAALNASNVNEAAERMLNMIEQRKTLQLGRTATRADIVRVRSETDRIRENISLMKQDGVLKALDIELKKQGINPNDPMWARIVGRLLGQVVGDSPSRSFWDYFRNN